MSLKKLEQEVKKNSALLEKKMDALMKTDENKYAVFHNGKHFIAQDFPEGVQKGLDEFGAGTGFTVQKITHNKPVLSSLVVEL